jgi:hypothetical protein
MTPIDRITRRQLRAVRRCVGIVDTAGYSAMTASRLSRSVIRSCVTRGWLMRLDDPVFADDDSDCEHGRVGYVPTEAGRTVAKARKR